MTKILVLNAGSSSVKFAAFDWDRLTLQAGGIVELNGSSDSARIRITWPEHDRTDEELPVRGYRQGVVAAFRYLESRGFLRSGDGVAVVAHRLIHGGESLREPVVIDDRVKQIISQFTSLAPLHIPAGLEAIAAAEEAFPEALQTGVFDTAFFADIPPAAYLYPVPYEWYERWGIRRFGYHGTSHVYAMERAAEMLGRSPAELRLITCHLGQGSSATAIQAGKAVTNTMGFTPLEGFMMGTRSGTIDPGLITYVQKIAGLSADEIEDVLHRNSGLLGVSGVSGDFRKVEEAAKSGNDRARLALEMYAYRVRAMLGSLAVTMGGVDALVFTGGIGENAAGLRRDICRGLGCLGLELNEAANAQASPDCDVSREESPGRILVVKSREDLLLAREGKRLAVQRLHVPPRLG